MTPSDSASNLARNPEQTPPASTCCSQLLRDEKFVAIPFFNSKERSTNDQAQVFPASPHFCLRQSRPRRSRNRRCKNRARRHSIKASVRGGITTWRRMRLPTAAISICRWSSGLSSAMCAVRRGIDRVMRRAGWLAARPLELNWRRRETLHPARRRSYARRRRRRPFNTQNKSERPPARFAKILRAEASNEFAREPDPGKPR